MRSAAEPKAERRRPRALRGAVMSEFPPFRARAPWLGPDLQTVRNAVRGPIVARRFAATPVMLPLVDGTGDALVGALSQPAQFAEPAQFARPAQFAKPEQFAKPAQKRPLVVLVHGLSGSADSAYMLASASHWLSRGHPVLRLNLRGAGESRAHCRLQYHAGRTADLRDALSALDALLLQDGLVLVGYSLGGNMLLKFLAEHGERFPIRAGASVSAPIDLSAASQRFLARRNRLYHLRLLRTMKRESFEAPSMISENEREAVLGARSIYEFDEHFVAPRNGFRNAEHYYAENHARRFLADIRVPTLVVHSLDDPWIPSSAYTTYAWKNNPALHPLLAPGGGHVGFHARDDRVPWHDRCIAAFVDRVCR